MRSARKALLAATTFGLLAMPSIARADVIIGPRASYYFDNSNLRQSNLDGLQDARQRVDEETTALLREAIDDSATLTVTDNGSATRADQTAFPMIGGLVNFGSDRDRFTVTAMYGSGKSSTEQVSSRLIRLEIADVFFQDISLAQATTRLDSDRIDVEATWQRRLNENFAISAGLRYERLDTTGSGSLDITETDTVVQVVADALGTSAPPSVIDAEAPPVRLTTSTKLETFSARAGVTAFVPVNDGLTAFFSGMVQGGYQPDTTVTTTFFDVNDAPASTLTEDDRGELSIGPDFAVGAQVVITENIALDIRYRAILFFPLSGDLNFKDSRVNHGVNVGVSLRL